MDGFFSLLHQTLKDHSKSCGIQVQNLMDPSPKPYGSKSKTLKICYLPSSLDQQLNIFLRLSKIRLDLSCSLFYHQFTKWILRIDLHRKMWLQILKKLLSQHLVIEIYRKSEHNQIPGKTRYFIWLSWYSWFHIKGSWNVHSFNRDYLSIHSSHR